MGAEAVIPSRSVLIAVALAVLLVAGAVTSWFQAASCRKDADWQLARGNAAAAQYAQSFDSAVGEQQLATFERRREILEQEHGWTRLEMVCVLAALTAGFASYLLHLLSRVTREVDDGSVSELP